MVLRGGDYGRWSGECGWWCMMVMIMGGDVVNVIGGA